jgi:hypothetical protein
MRPHGLVRGRLAIEMLDLASRKLSVVADSADSGWRGRRAVAQRQSRGTQRSAKCYVARRRPDGPRSAVREAVAVAPRRDSCLV